MALLNWVIYSSLLGVVFSCDAYIKTNQWPDRSVIVHLFEWKWLDIAEECERFLGPKGFGGVQTSPASENLVIKLRDGSRPWYERYQVMSYKLSTRSGTEEEFLNMTTRCNAVGVRIYVDVVFNHMTGNHSSLVGTGGSTADFASSSYPAVPYTNAHFHRRECIIKDYENATEVRVCQLVGLKDLNQGIPYVRRKVSEYLNKLISLGVAGFRVDAAKHMWPEDLKAIYELLDNLNTRHGFRPKARAYIYQEVTYGGVVTGSEYIHIGDVTEFNVGTELSKVFTGRKPLNTLVTWGATSGPMLRNGNAFVFVDNHDTQRYDNVLTYKNATYYKVATAFLLAHTYGQPRIMSSYSFDDIEQGPPSDADGNIQSPVINEVATAFLLAHTYGQPRIMSSYSFDDIEQGPPSDADGNIQSPVINEVATAFLLAHTYGQPRIMSSYSFDDIEQGPPSDADGNIQSPVINEVATAFLLAHTYGQPRIMSSYSFDDIEQGPPSDADGNIQSPVINEVATAFLLAHTYGQPRIMSSYSFDDIEQGPPSDADGNIQSPVINEDESCTEGWICEHRWGPTYKMIGFKNEVSNTVVQNWWDNGNNQIAFSRGHKGFIAFNMEGTAMDVQLQTSLPAGTYCDIISGQKQGSMCTGKSITVSSTGVARITLSGTGEELHLAIHIGKESLLQKL